MAEQWAMFKFAKRVAIDEIEGTLRLACLATESLHGPDRVRLEVRYGFDQANRTVSIDMTSPVGRTLALIFSGYSGREFGSEAMEIRSSPTGAREGTAT